VVNGLAVDFRAVTDTFDNHRFRFLDEAYPPIADPEPQILGIAFKFPNVTDAGFHEPLQHGELGCRGGARRPEPDL
jgi:hypothetical protein